MFKGDSSLTCTTNLWYCHATNIYFDLKNLNPDASNNRLVLRIIKVKIYTVSQTYYAFILGCLSSEQ